MTKFCIGFLTVVLTGSAVGYPRVSSACDPSTDYDLELIRKDLPECVKIESIRDDGNFQTAPMRVKNKCDRPISVAATLCELCSDGLTLAADERRELRIDRGGVNGSVNQVDFDWDDGMASGTFQITVTTWPSGCGGGLFGCHCLGLKRPGQPWPLLFVLGLAAAFLRRRKPYGASRRLHIGWRYSNRRS